jgi:hypothetical protein
MYTYISIVDIYKYQHQDVRCNYTHISIVDTYIDTS